MESKGLRWLIERIRDIDAIRDRCSADPGNALLVRLDACRGLYRIERGDDFDEVDLSFSARLADYAESAMIEMEERAAAAGWMAAHECLPANNLRCIVRIRNLRTNYYRDLEASICPDDHDWVDYRGHLLDHDSHVIFWRLAHD